jgi:hypothetical protein
MNRRCRSCSNRLVRWSAAATRLRRSAHRACQRWGALLKELRTARSAQIRLRIMLPVAHTLRYTILKALRFISMNAHRTRGLDGGLSASVHHHERQYAPHAQEARELGLAEIAQLACTPPTQQQIGILSAIKPMVCKSFITRSG